MRECNDYEITVEKLLKVTNNYTEKIVIHVVGSGGFDITTDASVSQEEMDRILKYYADVPVWNLHVETSFTTGFLAASGSFVVAAIVANCHYADMREGYLLEKEDIRKAKRREYNQRRKAKKNDT